MVNELFILKYYTAAIAVIELDDLLRNHINSRRWVQNSWFNEITSCKLSSSCLRILHFWGFNINWNYITLFSLFHADGYRRFISYLVHLYHQCCWKADIINILTNILLLPGRHIPEAFKDARFYSILVQIIL